MKGYTLLAIVSRKYQPKTVPVYYRPLVHFLPHTVVYLFIYLFGVLCRFQHCTGHITTGSWKGRGNQYIEFARVLYCKLPTNGKQLPGFPHKALMGIEPRPQRWEVRVLPLCHRGPYSGLQTLPLSNRIRFGASGIWSLESFDTFVSCLSFRICSASQRNCPHSFLVQLLHQAVSCECL